MTYGGNAGTIELVVESLTGDPEQDWLFETNGAGVMVAEPKIFGRVYLHDPHDEEDLLFVARAQQATRALEVDEVGLSAEGRSMGLDGVEIVMRTEETFGIEIPNEVAARLLTPAALVDYVAANVPLKATDECLSQQMFYRLRRGFRSQLKALSSTFELDTPLKEILHKDQWPQVWAAIRAEVGEPEWPVSIRWPGLLSDGPKTVRELIWQVAASLPKPDIAAGEAWTRPRIQAEVRRIVGEQVGAWDYSLKARFVDDIGIS